MSDSDIIETSYIIEVWGEAAGIAVPEGDAIRFHAAAPRFAPLDGRRFPSVGQARLAAVRHDRLRNRPEEGEEPKERQPFARYDLTDSSTAYWSR